MGKIMITCPECALFAPENRIGQSGKCPKCGASLQIPQGKSQEVPVTDMAALRALAYQEDTDFANIAPFRYHSPIVKNHPNTGAGTASLILGIISLCLPIGIGIIPGILGIHYARRQQRTAPTGTATAGLICSIVGICLSALCLMWAAITVFMLISLGSGVGVAP